MKAIRASISRAVVTLAVSATALALPAHAASLDSSFGTGGLVSTAFGSYGAASRVAIQADGRVLVTGQDALGDFTLVRYTSAGVADTSFNATGKVVTTPSGSCSAQSRALSIQADGKIVVVGSSCPNFNSLRNFTLYRYNVDGSLDTTFGSAGKVTTNFSVGASEAFAVVARGSSILVGGYAGTKFALARYTATGAPDATFGSGTGMVTTTVGTSSAFVNSLAVQSDGKIVLAGYAVSSGTVFALARYQTTGALDTSFGTGGIVTTNVGGTFSGNSAIANAVAIQGDGKIVAAGYANVSSSSTYRFAVVRYTASGALDTDFNFSGKVLTAIGSSDAIGRDLAIDSLGRIVVAGYSKASTLQQLTLARYYTDGTMDTTFGPVATTVGTANATAQGLAIQSDGKIVVTGYGNSPLTFVTARYQ